AYTGLVFDGDTIVADQRVMYDDPQAIERITPDTDGRYVVMVWNWCWEASPPRLRPHRRAAPATRPPAGVRDAHPHPGHVDAARPGPGGVPATDRHPQRCGLHRTTRPRRRGGRHHRKRRQRRAHHLLLAQLQPVQLARPGSVRAAMPPPWPAGVRGASAGGT